MRAGTVAAAVAVFAAAASGRSEPVVRTSLDPAQGGWFVCDSVSTPYAAFVAKPDVARQSLVMLLDRRTGRSTTTAYRVGEQDAGAGSLFWTLRRDGVEAGAIRMVNPRMVGAAPGDLPPVRQLRLGAVSLDCRWINGLRFLGLDVRRSVTVSMEAGKLIYRAYDAGRPALAPDGVQATTAATATVVGGRDDGIAWRFDKGGFTYVVDRSGIPVLTVLKGGARVQTEPLVMAAWQAPARMQAGDAPIWSGEGLDDCRAAAAGDPARCLIARMRATGATPAAIAFAQRIAGRGDAGYVSRWRQAGPIGVATVAYPFRANTNEGSVLVPSAGNAIFVDDYRLGTQAMARADYKALVARAGAVTPFAPATISGRRPLVGQPIVIRARTPMATCHACAPAGALVVDYEFDAAGRLTMTRLVSIG